MKQAYNQEPIISKGPFITSHTFWRFRECRQAEQGKTWPLVIFHKNCTWCHTNLNAFRLPENRFPKGTQNLEGQGTNRSASCNLKWAVWYRGMAFTEEARRVGLLYVNAARVFIKAAKQAKANQQNKKKVVAWGITFVPVFKKRARQKRKRKHILKWSKAAYKYLGTSKAVLLN